MPYIKMTILTTLLSIQFLAVVLGLCKVEQKVQFLYIPCIVPLAYQHPPGESYICYI